MNDDNIKEIAKRIFELIPPWDRDDMTETDVENEIIKDPIATIKYLLDYIDN